MGVEEDREAIGVGDDIAPRQPTDDARRVAVVQAGADIDRIVVISQPELRLLARGLPFVGQALDEARHDGRLLPGRVVQASIDADGRGRASGVDGWAILGGERLRPTANSTQSRWREGATARRDEE